MFDHFRCHSTPVIPNAQLKTLFAVAGQLQNHSTTIVDAIERIGHQIQYHLFDLLRIDLSNDRSG